MICGIPTTKKEKIQMKMYKLHNEISSIVNHGAKWNFNLTTGECECILRKLSNKEAQEVENLKAELKQLEIELKLIKAEEDFENMENE